MIKLAEIAQTRFVQWLRETTISQKIALGLGTVLVVGIVSYGGYTLYNNRNGGSATIEQKKQEVKVSEVQPTTATKTNTAVVTEVVTPYVEPAVTVDPNAVVESNASSYEVVTTAGEDYYYAPDGGHTEYVEETPTYSEPTYSEPTPTYSEPEPTYTAPVDSAPANDWGSVPNSDGTGDPWGDGSGGGESN